SGFAFPRPAAMHLRKSPEFSASGADWTKDSIAELVAYLKDTHAELNVMSVHIYEGPPLPGFVDSDASNLIALAGRIAQQLGKKLFIGEVGARSTSGPKAQSFLDRALSRIEAQRVPYTAFWVWEYYQTSTYRTFDSEATELNIEPGYTDWLIQRIARMNGISNLEQRKQKDSIAPIALITWPLECARVDKSFRIHVAASDDSGVPPTV